MITAGVRIQRSILCEITGGVTKIISNAVNIALLPGRNLHNYVRSPGDIIHFARKRKRRETVLGLFFFPF